MTTHSSAKSVIVSMHNGKVVSVTGKHDPLLQARYLVGVAESLKDQHVIEAARAVLAQMTQLIEQKLDLSLPGDQELLAGYHALRVDYLSLVDGFRQMHQSNEKFRAEVVVMIKVEENRTKRVVWAQTAKGSSEFYVTPDLQFNRVLQNRALEQAGRFIAEDLASRFLLQLESGQLAKPIVSPASTGADTSSK